ncbi:helix-turn-helix transcriptional regulator [Microbispora sp. SCL1-1]|uniref:helix-turn-helix domain-containing protein n=1 Tax=unclassified Microbispora TaxID=2614687 RepID=UPI001157C2F0|nr:MULTISPECIES: helix-turn-helix transcriptional regulator [unclassified Microbispora]NJP25704.1 helix-turn-helix transcriptional regulator [Microbispora sp. CL1-1]TQS13199.1 helix-turn-helix transcriptional regulator [Microbispora sp. SCL1-1]
MSDNTLGEFLRSRREAVTPAEVGLPGGGRRRTPGLRRSELATLAGISVEYLTRLEQGRDRHPSVPVLAALADALRLSSDDRLHLLHHFKAADGAGRLVGPCQGPPAQSVRPTVRALLDRLEPAPAVVVNRLGDVLAHTNGYERLAGPIGLLDRRPPNLVRYVFADPRAKAAYPEWDRVAGERLAALKPGISREDPHVERLVNELTLAVGAPFTDRLATPPGPPRRTGLERLAHPEAGELRLAYETLGLSGDDSQVLIAYLPADDATAARLDRLTGRHPGALRAVSG